MSNFERRATFTSSYQSQNMNMSSLSLNASLLIDKIVVMRRSEQSSYLYGSYFKEPPMKSNCTDPGEFSLWREKICHWTYTVIDHFNLSRRTVAISMDLFDRFLATLGNNCDGNQALLISLTTLYISIKIHERKKIKLLTLSDLSRSQFTPKEIEDMEMRILQSLCWLIHPPTPIDFISQVLKFLPASVTTPVRHHIFEIARYVVELSVCDPYFVKAHSSTTAFAAILNVLEDDIEYDTIPRETRERFLTHLHRDLNLHRGRPQTRAARDRLRNMVAASNVTDVSCIRETSTPSPVRKNKQSHPKEHARPKDTVIKYKVITPDKNAKHRSSAKSRRVRSNSIESAGSVSSRGSSLGSFLPSRKGAVTPC
mmetsp:Transcript_13984/g.20885  ORF Transcript_13984/g.20885 Transcript_13984/m.20885 type:complete len:369 (+) Transcript_13984:65-1171(+)